jgi:hypothetical protein
MFCSSCGAAITPELNYCKRCGTELGGLIKQSNTEIESLIWAIVAVTVGGIAVLIGLVAVLKEVFGSDTRLVGLLSVMSFFLLLIADVSLIWLLLTRSRTKKKKPVQLKEAEAQRLYDAPARELAEPMPMQSVTEHTTRSLEPALREQKKQ